MLFHIDCDVTCPLFGLSSKNEELRNEIWNAYIHIYVNSPYKPLPVYSNQATLK